MLLSLLAMLSFISPWMAWGAIAAVGLPLLAHLLSKTRYKEVAFPAARLVKQAVVATSRIESPRHRLLMLLRWLLLMLLVVAIMRPQWTPQASAVKSDQGVALILLVDASASMQRTVDGATLMDRAMREARQLINALDPSRDVAAVIRVDCEPVSLLPEATGQLTLLTEQLAAIKPSYETANWQAALAAALRLSENNLRAVRIVTLSDQQGDPPSLANVTGDFRRPAIDHVRIQGPTDNTAVRLLDLRPYPAIVGQPITATVEVQHFTSQPITVQLGATLNAIQTKQTLTLAPNSTERIDILLPQVSGERELLQITIDASDAMPWDNLTGAVVPVQRETRTLIVHDANAASTTLAKRIGTLLNPGQLEGAVLPSVDMLPLNEAMSVLEDADPASLRTVVLINREPLSQPLSQRLEAYVQAGGGVVQWDMDVRADPNRLTSAAGIDFDLAPLRVFEGPARAGLASLQWPGVSNAPIDPRAQPILMDVDERIIVAAMPRGRGQVIAINAAVSPGPGGLLAQPAFVVLFNELCRFASPGISLPDPPRPGDALPSDLLNAAQRRIPDDGDLSADRFTVPGVYTGINARGDIEAIDLAQLHPAESDTRDHHAWMTSDDLVGTDSQRDSSDTADVAASIRSNPIELWPYLVFAVLGLAAAESLMLWRFAKPHRGVSQRGTA